jgi:hypothetical protein
MTWHCVCYLSLIFGGSTMLRNVAITVYIFIILIISGFAKASTPIVTKLEYNESMNKITVAGYALDTCKHAYVARAELVAGPEKLAYLNIESLDPEQICGMGAAREYKFELIFDVRTLGLPQGEYTVKLSNKSTASSELNVLVPGDLISLPEPSQIIDGTLVAFANGQFAIVKSETEFTMVKSKIDLSQYAGQYVSASGYELQFSVQPIDIVSQNPFEQIGSEKPVAFFVLGISSIAE